MSQNKYTKEFIDNLVKTVNEDNYASDNGSSICFDGNISKKKLFKLIETLLEKREEEIRGELCRDVSELCETIPVGNLEGVPVVELSWHKWLVLKDKLSHPKEK